MVQKVAAGTHRLGGNETLIVQKYGNVDADDIRMKLDAIKQEPKERVQKYFE